MGPASQHVSPLLCHQGGVLSCGHVDMLFCKHSSISCGRRARRILSGLTTRRAGGRRAAKKAPCGIAATLVFDTGRRPGIGARCRIGLSDDAGSVVGPCSFCWCTVQDGPCKRAGSLGDRGAKHQTMFKTDNNTTGFRRWRGLLIFYGRRIWGMGNRSTRGRRSIRA